MGGVRVVVPRRMVKTLHVNSSPTLGRKQSQPGVDQQCPVCWSLLCEPVVGNSVSSDRRPQTAFWLKLASTPRMLPQEQNPRFYFGGGGYPSGGLNEWFGFGLEVLVLEGGCPSDG